MFIPAPASITRLAAIIALAVSSAHGAMVVTHFDPASALPVTIGAATISYVHTPESSGYYKFGVTTDIGGFGWFQNGDACYYWFRSTDSEDFDALNVALVGTYQSVFARAGYAENTASLVDGARWGNDNYLSYYDTNGTMVAVLRFAFTEGTENVRLVSMAVDTDGITFGDGIRSASIPEPSVSLFGLATAGLLCLRRFRGR